MPGEVIIIIITSVNSTVAQQWRLLFMQNVNEFVYAVHGKIQTRTIESLQLQVKRYIRYQDGAI